MPKKFAGENSKAEAARVRKEAALELDKLKKLQEVEDAKWKDNDKSGQKKLQRRDELERKKQEQFQKKTQAKAMLEEEMAQMQKTPQDATARKITRAQIHATNSGTLFRKETEKKIESHLDVPVEENLNRMSLEGEVARTITEAIGLLEAKDETADKHPEKRMKAAYTAYEQRRVTDMKTANPNLKLSQMKRIIFKEWQKSPENPLNK